MKLVYKPLFLPLIIFVLCLLTTTSGFGALKKIKSRTNPDVQKQAVEDLIQRLIPERAGEFRVIVDPRLSGDDLDTFQLKKTSDTTIVQITGSSGVAAAWGFHYYLTQFCNCHVSWDADQVKLPVILPEVDVVVQSHDRFRYYQNVCTVSYSSVWWSWERWEREIDWMAMNGINLPLAFTGQEAIWQRVFSSLGLEQKDIDEHFSGPAFLAWQRMGNLRGWGGSLSSHWHAEQVELQHKILSRMRNFGMIPVLPAFAGHSPRALTQLFPNSSFTQLTPWLKFEDRYCCPAFLQPTDPLFDQIGASFLKEMTAEFGTDHVYNCDVYNEMRPLQGDPEYIAQVGGAVYRAMTKGDPHAVWLLQGWLFNNDAAFWTKDRARALLTSVPLGKMIVLDLHAEVSPQYDRLESYFGQPFIFCMLHNFGGTLGMYGSLQRIAKGVVAARSFPNTTIVGTGLTMEGINQNYILYDHMLEMGWRNEVPELRSWVEDYAVRRYGSSSTSLMRAWTFLQRSVYCDVTENIFHARFYVLVCRPELDKNPALWYNPDDVILAWDGFIEVGQAFRNVSTYRHDLVDVTRQAMQEIFNLLYSEMVTAYWKKNQTTFREVSSLLIEVLHDLDLVLQTSPNFLLGRWLKEAKERASTPQEAIQFEWNARNQITLWGPRGEILDYATKQWAGVVGDYYKPRWELFAQKLDYCLQHNVTFNRTQYAAEVFGQVEKPFTFDSKIFPSEPVGDSVVVAVEMYEKWRSIYTRRKEAATRTALKFWRNSRTTSTGTKKLGNQKSTATKTL